MNNEYLVMKKALILESLVGAAEHTVWCTGV